LNPPLSLSLTCDTGAKVSKVMSYSLSKAPSATKYDHSLACKDHSHLSNVACAMEIGREGRGEERRGERDRGK
jgi:hypothetical protein